MEDRMVLSRDVRRREEEVMFEGNKSFSFTREKTCEGGQ
jgi:hypothetical protein